MDKPLVFIAHPIRGDIHKNLVNAGMWVRWANLNCDVHAVAPYMGLCIALNDGYKRERRIGMEVSNRVLELCDELWLCGESISTGMAGEMELAYELGIPVVDLTGKEYPGA